MSPRSMLMDAECEGVVKINLHAHIWFSFASHKAVSRGCWRGCCRIHKSLGLLYISKARLGGSQATTVNAGFEEKHQRARAMSLVKFVGRIDCF